MLTIQHLILGRSAGFPVSLRLTNWEGETRKSGRRLPATKRFRGRPNAVSRASIVTEASAPRPLAFRYRAPLEYFLLTPNNPRKALPNNHTAPGTGTGEAAGAAVMTRIQSPGSVTIIVKASLFPSIK